MQAYTKAQGKVTTSHFKLKAGLRRLIERGNKPYFKGIPDKIDQLILSEIIFIKRTFLKDEKIFLASLDTDFIPGWKDSVLRDKIVEKFDVICDNPAKIYAELKKGK